MSMDADPYRVDVGQGAPCVRDEKGGTILTCTDEQSAVQYAVLLNRTYRAGYKSGYRDAKRGEPAQ